MLTTSDTKRNLLQYDHAAMVAFCAEIGEPSFRASQLIQWIHQFGYTDFDKMTNLSKALRQRLHDIAEIRIPEVISEKVARDGTTKWLIKIDDVNCIETVFIPERTRGTLCVSSQVGCSLNCSFCATGKQGFNRNLSVADIIAQLWIAVRRLASTGHTREHAITNVVMMGMGEPLLNYDAVVSAMSLMLDDYAYNLSKYRVTLSTSGLIPQMKKLRQQSPVALAVSLHAPNDELRNELVPINKKYPLKELIQVCTEYFKDEPRRSVTFEYVMLDGVNDQILHAKQLVSLIQKSNVRCKVNLIPFNPFPNTQYQCSPWAVIEKFQKTLMAADINTVVRRTRGDGIDAACGQLAGDFKDKVRRRDRLTRQLEIPIAVESAA